MIRRRSAFVLCALAVFAAVAAPSANAVTKGTTIFTCKKTGPGGEFTKSHCKAGDKGSGEYKHVAVAEKTTTEISGYNDNTSGGGPWKLKSTVGGVELEIQAGEVPIAGEIENRMAATGEHTIEALFAMVFRQATVTKPNDPKCVIKTDELATKKPGAELEIDFRSLIFTTAGQGDALKFQPQTGTVLASFFIEGCTNKALNKTYELTGSFVTSSVDGATFEFTHASTTTQNTLKLSGEKAGIEGSLYIEGRDNSIPGDLMNPLSFTTVETP